MQFLTIYVSGRLSPLCGYLAASHGVISFQLIFLPSTPYWAFFDCISLQLYIIIILRLFYASSSPSTMIDTNIITSNNLPLPYD